ncbi:large subunit ribosomal protein L10 [Geosmithia morbida]|uniref:Large subunit ribosomal protein L10 n=1 Tax=Geosmithia morbida TaxID=1094350 RepID=A0A9P4YSM7_9HYPO|nr:large subunit ribosomal protein L10 [Geosmithia morbida]KAF4122378.1 large subunit ribosomal protein L10 [Geosmithia morbida]
MTCRIVQAAGPCLQRLGKEPLTQQRACALALANFSTSTRHQYASVRNATAAAQSPVGYAPSTKPPSARPVETRKSQMIRTYTSLLRTTPLILFFQHNNLTAVEWAAIRRELYKAMEAVPAPSAAGVESQILASEIKLAVVRTNMLNVAMKIVEYHNPEAAALLSSTARTSKGPIVHDLSEAAYKTIKDTPVSPDSAYGQIEPLMVGPLAALTIPAVSPAHLAAALRVISPVPGKFPAPKKKTNPGYHEPTCQNALAKLLLVGARVEGNIFDQEGVRWIGGIESGLDGLRAQLVHVLQSAGLGVTTALEGGSKSLWLALEGRKSQLEEWSGEKKTEE